MKKKEKEDRTKFEVDGKIPWDKETWKGDCVMR